MLALININEWTRHLSYIFFQQDVTSPRTVAELQIAKLAELQPEIKIKSASEVEFDIRLDDAYRGKDFGHTANWCSINVLDDHQVCLKNDLM